MTTTSPLFEYRSGRPAVVKPPCANRPDDWDLDVGTPETWRAAVQICHDCPLFAECAELAATLTAKGQAPRAMIWAGLGYDNSGNVIPALDRHRVLPVDVARPSIIVRTSRAPLSVVDSALTASAAAVPAGRKIVLRRGCRHPMAAGE